MEARAFAEAYVHMDRLLHCDLRQSPEKSRLLQEALVAVERQISLHARASEHLQSLCDQGCERGELLWILLGCDGLPGLRSSPELFGRNADQLNRNLVAIQEAANIIENINRYPFGVLLRGTMLFRLSELPNDRLSAATLPEFPSPVGQDFPGKFGPHRIEP